ncbi:SdrD B-like domain-containing protein [Cnuibacter sp. UC19_7]|uniref:SdrD B-like domain-containing protein n=1 Tax=Cnuibacter sp. UC19_7 TaxID=3350166 RepID=UPI0036735055
MIVQQIDGTPAFDALDADASNGLVRTNDNVTYHVSVQSQGGAQTAPTLVFDLPQGQELTSMPNYCLAGSSVVPASLGTLTPPITPTSWQSYPVQTVTCVLADRPSNPTTIDYDFTAKVRPEVPDGTVMTPFDTTATSTAVSDGTTISDTSNQVQVEVVSQADYDLSKNGTSNADDSSGRVDIQTTTCTNPAYTAAGYVGCQTMLFPILISVQGGGKGNTLLGSDITFTEDITPDVFWGAGTTAKPGWDSTLAPTILGCGAVTGLENGASFYPYGAISGHADTNSVRDSGTISCDEGATGVTTVTISGADTSAVTYPSTNGTGNVTMPADKAYVVSGWITIEYPVAAISAIGIPSPNSTTGSFQLPYYDTFSDLTADDLNGDPIPAEENLDNNVRHGTAFVETEGAFGKFFEGEPGNTANAGGPGYASGSFAGPPGSSALRDGNGIVQPGGKVLSGLSEGMVSPPGFGSGTQITCDTWDNTKLSLTAAQWRGIQAGTTSPAAPFPTTGFWQQYPSNGAAVWMTYASSPTLPNYTVEYNNGAPGTTSVNDCLDGGAGWVTDPALVPGNDPALAATGVYTAVSQVRIITDVVKSSIGEDLRLSTAFSIGFTVRSDVQTGDIIGNWGSTKQVLGDTLTPPSPAEAFAQPASYELESSYGPEFHTGRAGDRLRVQAVTARVVKDVWDPSTSTWATSTVPIYAAGVNADYRLRPSLTAGVTTGAMADTVVEDCLPANQSFVSSSLEGGGPITPAVISTDANPPGANVSCATGQTYVRWELGELTINTPIPAILYTVAISGTAPNGILTNMATITAEGDTSTLAERSSTVNIQIQTPTGIKLDKTVVNPLIEVNPAGATNPRPLGWTVQFAAIDTSGVSNVDIIDVLPANGLNGTSFTGTLAFDSGTVTASSGTAALLYTSKPAASLSSDPDAATNGAGGVTVWCDAPSGGSVVSGAGTSADCPTGASTVTGLRVQRAGAFTAGSTIDIAVRMIPLGNTEGDVYNNSAQADAQGVLQGVGPVQRAITAIASEIGDLVWNDLNSNGIQDAGEPGVAGVPVSLSGTDADGNTITASTTTDANGAYTFGNLPSGTYVVTFDPAWVASHNYGFTLKGQGTDTQIDSNADQTTGASDPIALGVNESRFDIDAGLVQLLGGLVIVKDIAGAGASQATGPFEFTVGCTYLGRTVYQGQVSLERAGDETTLTSDRIDGIPIGASCTITETGTGGADTAPPAVTVLITVNGDDNTVTAGFVNEFSAGTISVAKILTGTDADSDTVKAKVFTVQVTCQIEVDGLEEPATVFSGIATVRGGETVTATDATGATILLPLGSVCFGTETDTGGADRAVVDHATFDTGATVGAGTPDDLQALTITATNTFDKKAAAPATSGPLASTGLNVAGVLAVVAVPFLLGGMILVIVRRRARRA